MRHFLNSHDLAISVQNPSEHGLLGNRVNGVKIGYKATIRRVQMCVNCVGHNEVKCPDMIGTISGVKRGKLASNFQH